MTSGILIFNYEETIQNNEGLLNDLILNIDEGKTASKKEIQEIIQVYENAYNAGVYQKTYPMQKFFNERVKTRLKRLV